MSDKKYITVYCMYCNEPLYFQAEDVLSVCEIFVSTEHKCRKEYE